MKKIYFVCSIALLPLFANAATESSITAVPTEVLNIPDSAKKKIIERNKQQEEKGYFETESQYAKFLLNSERIAAQQIHQYKNLHNDERNDYIRSSYKEINLNNTFKPLSFIKKDNIFGYSPLGGWGKNGWTGIKTFFKDKKLICTYSKFSVPQQAIYVGKEKQTFQVNNKPSMIDIEGNGAGYLYSVYWFEKNTMNQMECADQIYDANNIKKVIDLAKLADKSQE